MGGASNKASGEHAEEHGGTAGQEGRDRDTERDRDRDGLGVLGRTGGGVSATGASERAGDSGAEDVQDAADDLDVDGDKPPTPALPVGRAARVRGSGAGAGGGLGEGMRRGSSVADGEGEAGEEETPRPGMGPRDEEEDDRVERIVDQVVHVVDGVRATRCLFRPGVLALRQCLCCRCSRGPTRASATHTGGCTCASVPQGMPLPSCCGAHRARPAGSLTRATP
jgi:hypothetical protein